MGDEQGPVPRGATPAGPPGGAAAPPPAGDSPALPALIAEQGEAELATFEQLLGVGKDLWESDEEFEEFMASIGRPVPKAGRP